MPLSIKNLAVFTAMGAAAAALPQQANAALLIELESGASTVTVADQSILDIDPTVGSVSFSGSVGDFDVNVSTGISKPVIGSPTEPRLNLDSVNVTSATTGSIAIRVTSTDFVGPVGAGIPTTLDFGGTTNGTAEISAFVDSSNAVFGMATPAGALGPFGTGPFDASDAAAVGLTAPFSATLEAIVVHDDIGDATSFGGEFRVVPEPGSLALIAIGAGLAGLRRRRA